MKTISCSKTYNNSKYCACCFINYIWNHDALYQLRRIPKIGNGVVTTLKNPDLTSIETQVSVQVFNFNQILFSKLDKSCV